MSLDYTQYVSKLTIKPCPEMPKPPKSTETDPSRWTDYSNDLAGYKAQFVDHVKSLREWADDQATLLAKFRTDLILAYGLATNPKADALYQLATLKNRATLEDIESNVAQLAPLVL